MKWSDFYLLCSVILFVDILLIMFVVATDPEASWSIVDGYIVLGLTFCVVVFFNERAREEL